MNAWLPLLLATLLWLTDSDREALGGLAAALNEAIADAQTPPAPDPAPPTKPPPKPVEPAPEIETPAGRVPLPSKPAPLDAAPIVTIKAPRAIEEHHMVHVEFEFSGGPVRESEITIEPDHDEAPSTDPKHIYFTGPPGIYTIRILAIGKNKGFARQEARMQIRQLAPPHPPMPAAARTTAPTPAELLAEWIDGVPSSNKKAEATEIGAAAHDTASAIRAGRINPGRAVDEWASASFLRMGAPFANWNLNPHGKSFFAAAKELFQENAKIPKSNPANLLDSLGDLLEGK